MCVGINRRSVAFNLSCLDLPALKNRSGHANLHYALLFFASSLPIYARYYAIREVSNSSCPDVRSLTEQQKDKDNRLSFKSLKFMFTLKPNKRERGTHPIISCDLYEDLTHCG